MLCVRVNMWNFALMKERMKLRERRTNADRMTEVSERKESDCFVCNKLIEQGQKRFGDSCFVAFENGRRR